MVAHNVVFITVDSCSFDAAVAAHTPNLDAIGPLRRGEVAGTYTFPSHQSFFRGGLPRPIDGAGALLPGFEEIWRSSSAREKDIQALEPFAAASIIDHYQQAGFAVCGFGGVSFFNSTNPHNSLPRMFENFVYFQRPRDAARYPRHPFTFPLNHIEEIAQAGSTTKPYFIFVNEPATHIPYDWPGSLHTSEDAALIERLRAEHFGPHTTFYSDDELPFSAAEISRMRAMQIDALQWVDGQIGLLVQALPDNGNPTLWVVTGDHGEEFGEDGRFGHSHASPSVMEVPLWVGMMDAGI